MRIKSRQLPGHLTEYLRHQPETGIGNQIVTVVLKNGERYERVLVVNCQDIARVEGSDDDPFDGFDVERVIVTHDRGK